jgi:hypothetical protein
LAGACQLYRRRRLIALRPRRPRPIKPRAEGSGTAASTSLTEKSSKRSRRHEEAEERGTEGGWIDQINAGHAIEGDVEVVGAKPTRIEPGVHFVKPGDRRQYLRKNAIRTNRPRLDVVSAGECASTRRSRQFQNRNWRQGCPQASRRDGTAIACESVGRKQGVSLIMAGGQGEECRPKPTKKKPRRLGSAGAFYC